MRFRRPKILIERPDIAPMADIVLLLLIFFMLSTSFVMEPGIKVQLPQASTSEIDPQQELFLVIDKKGRLFIETKEIPRESLSGYIKKELQVHPNKLLIIKADKDVSHGIVVEVMDIARQSGVDRLAIATQLKQTAKRKGK